jgi:hypothetical protein
MLTGRLIKRKDIVEQSLVHQADEEFMCVTQRHPVVPAFALVTK